MEITEIALTVITALIGIIGFFVKKAFGSLDDKVSKSALEEVKKDVEANRTAIGKIKDNYLTKDDYFREQAKVDKKLDMIMDILMKLSRGGHSDES